MTRRSFGLSIALATALLAGGSARALSTSQVVAQGSGYQATYHVSLPGTLNGNDVVHALLLESDGSGQVLVESLGTLTPSSVTEFTHEVPFLPTSAMVIGLELPEPNVGDGSTHIAMWVDGDFAAAARGLRFSEAFPHSRHGLFIDQFLLAAGGDPGALEALKAFFATGDGASAAFTPGGSFALIFSTIIVPEPAGLLLGAGALLTLRARRRARAR